MYPCRLMRRLRRPIIILMALAIFSIFSLSLTPAASAAEQAKIKSLRVLMEGALLFIEVNMDRPLMPQVRAMYEDPEKPRLVIDFSETTLSTQVPGLIKSPSRLARQIRIGQHKNKVRIVVDLVPGFYYEADQVLYKQLKRYVIGLKAATKPLDSSKPLKKAN